MFLIKNKLKKTIVELSQKTLSVDVFFYLLNLYVLYKKKMGYKNDLK